MKPITNTEGELLKKATMLFATADMLWSPITYGEMFNLLKYMLENFDEVAAKAAGKQGEN